MSTETKYSQLRVFRHIGEEIVIKRKDTNDPEEYIRIKLCDNDLHSGKAEISVTAGQTWLIYKSESPRGTGHEHA